MRTIILLIAALSLYNISAAQKAAPSFTAIIVSDIDHSIKWYSSVFGMETINRTDNEVYGFRQANLGNKRWKLELIEMDSAVDPSELLGDMPKNVRLTGFFKAGFTVRKFDTWTARLERLKVSFKGGIVEDPVTGKRMVIALDPDGNRLQFFEK